MRTGDDVAGTVKLSKLNLKDTFTDEPLDVTVRLQ